MTFGVAGSAGADRRWGRGVEFAGALAGRRAAGAAGLEGDTEEWIEAPVVTSASVLRGALEVRLALVEEECAVGPVSLRMGGWAIAGDRELVGEVSGSAVRCRGGLVRGLRGGNSFSSVVSVVTEMEPPLAAERVHTSTKNR